jgi:hypothetical protein
MKIKYFQYFFKKEFLILLKIRIFRSYFDLNFLILKELDFELLIYNSF